MNDTKEPFELFGYECGPGWFPIIKEAKQLIDEWNKEHNDGADSWGGEKLKFVQVKEKWGELCLYLNFYPDGIFEKILALQMKSLKYCEQCGSDKDVKTDWTHHWLMTLCPECRWKEEKRWEAFHHDELNVDHSEKLNMTPFASQETLDATKECEPVTNYEPNKECEPVINYEPNIEEHN